MSLQNGAQLILQTERASGGFDCIGFTGLHITYPAVITLCAAGTLGAFAAVASLRAAFLARLQLVHPKATTVVLPCSGFVSDAAACHAQGEADCAKLLVL